MEALAEEFLEQLDELASLLAAVEGGEWGLWEYAADPTGEWVPEHPVSEPFADLIESGKRYPPAMALAREETIEVFDGHDPTPDDLQRTYSAALQAHLSRQY